MRLTFTVLIVLSFLYCNNGVPKEAASKGEPLNIESARIKAKQALDFCNRKEFNNDFCILIDMSVHSGLKRMMVWDFKKDTVSLSFLVAHGCCGNLWSNDFSNDHPGFSNVENSHCSSLGRFKIGERSYSSWGVHVKYALHGLDSTNSNAFKRFVVFHSWEAVPDQEVYPNGTPETWGCPAVSNKSFEIIDPLLNASLKPVLMWIYD